MIEQPTSNLTAAECRDEMAAIEAATRKAVAAHDISILVRQVDDVARWYDEQVALALVECILFELASAHSFAADISTKYPQPAGQQITNWRTP